MQIVAGWRGKLAIKFLWHVGQCPGTGHRRLFVRPDAELQHDPLEHRRNPIGLGAADRAVDPALEHEGRGANAHGPAEILAVLISVRSLKH
jgi:hypothetical protein